VSRSTSYHGYPALAGTPRPSISHMNSCRLMAYVYKSELGFKGRIKQWHDVVAREREDSPELCSI
jgi:hypothetical protein